MTATPRNNPKKHLSLSSEIPSSIPYNCAEALCHDADSPNVRLSSLLNCVALSQPMTMAHWPPAHVP